MTYEGIISERGHPLSEVSSLRQVKDTVVNFNGSLAGWWPLQFLLSSFVDPLLLHSLWDMVLISRQFCLLVMVTRGGGFTYTGAALPICIWFNTAAVHPSHTNKV